MSRVVPTQYLALVVSALSFLVASLSLKQGRSKSLKDNTDAVFKEWWSEDLRSLRKEFREDWENIDRVATHGLSLKKSNTSIIRLCNFFDRVGWLGAAGLIDVDYIMPPMQHVLRRVWLATEQMIKNDRSTDPVYLYGLEWLFRRSSKWYGQQGYLLWKMGMHPGLQGILKAFQMSQHDRRDEERYLRMLSRAHEQGRCTNSGRKSLQDQDMLGE